MNLLGLGNLGRIGGCLSTRYVLLGVGAVAGAVTLGRHAKEAKPYVVEVAKEAIAFGEWLSSARAEEEEYWEDVMAEAKHQYKQEVEQKLQVLQKQQEMLLKIKSNLE